MSPKKTDGTTTRVGYLESCEIYGTIATHDGSEEFALLSSGDGWLPLFSKGRAVACKVDERPVVEAGTYEYTFPKDGITGRVCSTPYTSSATDKAMSPAEIAAVTQSLVARGIRPGAVVLCRDLVTFPTAKKRFLLLADTSADPKAAVDNPSLWIEVSANVAVTKRTGTTRS